MLKKKTIAGGLEPLRELAGFNFSSPRAKFLNLYPFSLHFILKNFLFIIINLVLASSFLLFNHKTTKKFLLRKETPTTFGGESNCLGIKIFVNNTSIFCLPI